MCTLESVRGWSQLVKIGEVKQKEWIDSQDSWGDQNEEWRSQGIYTWNISLGIITWDCK